MFAGVVHNKLDIRYEEVETPVPKDDEVLVKVRYTGICGSDVPRVNGDACHFYPIILGHEFSGEISAVGENVESVKVGDRVAGIPLVPCMECEDCTRGDYSLCKHYSFIGSRRNGSFAEYVAVPESNVFPIGDDVDFRDAALFEPSTVAIHGIMRTDFVPGRTVAVLGCGLIGLLTIEWAKILGAKEIIAVNRSREKLKVALDAGATAAVSTLDSDYPDRISDLTDGRGVDYIFDATGNENMIAADFRIAANKAWVCMIGTPKHEFSFSVQDWELLNRKELMVTGSWMSYSKPFPGKEWEMTKENFRNGKLSVKDGFIDRIMGLSDIAKAFELYRRPGEVKGKILIDSSK